MVEDKGLEQQKKTLSPFRPSKVNRSLGSGLLFILFLLGMSIE